MDKTVKQIVPVVLH